MARKRKGVGKQNRFETTSPTAGDRLPTSAHIAKSSYLDRYPVLCLKYLQLNSSQFPLKCFKKTDDYKRLLRGLAKLCSMTWKEIEEKRDYWHAHEIQWKDTSRKRGFSRLGVLEGFEGYQFKAFDTCRIIGFHEGTVFRIVWLDREHKLYPDGKS